MKIIIDTSVDSPEEIKKIARFLLENDSGSSPTVETPQEGSFNLFDNSSEVVTEPENLVQEEPVKEPFKINDLIPYD